MTRDDIVKAADEARRFLERVQPALDGARFPEYTNATAKKGDGFW